MRRNSSRYRNGIAAKDIDIGNTVGDEGGESHVDRARSERSIRKIFEAIGIETVP
jgi:hypothetical protein